MRQEHGQRDSGRFHKLVPGPQSQHDLSLSVKEMGATPIGRRRAVVTWDIKLRLGTCWSLGPALEGEDSGRKCGKSVDHGARSGPCFSILLMCCWI